jgi:hypothetical protein
VIENAKPVAAVTLATRVTRDERALIEQERRRFAAFARRRPTGNP